MNMRSKSFQNVVDIEENLIEAWLIEIRLCDFRLNKSWLDQESLIEIKAIYNSHFLVLSWQVV